MPVVSPNREPTVPDEGAKTWTFLTNHSHVLLCIAEDPTVRTRDVAQLVGITERSAQRIIAELEEAGYVSHDKVGRRNRYSVNPELHLRHPLEDHLEVGALLRVLTTARDA